MSKKEGSLGSVENLTRIAGPIPIACAFIVVTEFCERLSYYGASSLFQNYMQHGPDDKIPGAFNMGSSMATLYNNLFSIFCYTSPILGAYIADKYLGRFRTILYFAMIYMVGWLILTVSSIPTGGSTAGRTATYSSFAFPGFLISLVVVGFGTGGIKASVGPMCADQISKEPYEIEKKGKKYLADPDMTIQSVYNWFYWAINIGALTGQYVCTNLEKDAFWKGYVIPTAFFAVAIIVFASGYKFYTHVPAEGSIYEKTWKVLMYAWKRQKEYKAAGKSIEVPKDVNFPFLSYANEIPGESAEEAKERTWDSSFVLELRQTLKMTYPSWITNDLINIIDPIVLLALIPLFDFVIYPYLNKHNIHFGYIKRISTGIFLGGLSMIWAAVVQIYIYRDPQFNAADSEGNQQASLSLWWQIPAYVLIAISEIFASIGSLEYSYTHAPESMKGMISALSLFPTAAASIIGIFLSPLSKDPYFTTLYFAAAGGCFFAVVLFYWLFSKYDEEDLALKNEKILANKKSIDQIRAEVVGTGAEV